MSTNHYKQAKQKTNLLYLIGGLVVLVLFIIFAAPKLLGGGSKEAPLNEQDHVEMNVDKITSKATFYIRDFNGTKMEFFAVKDSYGSVRIAFNRCQVCYESGRGYFKQQGDEFVCQNCGNRYKINMIGLEKGGCNPSPVTVDDKIVSGNTVEIKDSIFTENQYLFNK